MFLQQKVGGWGGTIVTRLLQVCGFFFTLFLYFIILHVKIVNPLTQNNPYSFISY